MAKASTERRREKNERENREKQERKRESREEWARGAEREIVSSKKEEKENLQIRKK